MVLPVDEDTGVLVSEKLTAVKPETEAVTLYEPAVALAIGTGDVAIPDALVIAEAELIPLKVALAPLPGAVNVTFTPDIGFEN